MIHLINLFQPSVGQAELAAVADVFASNWLGAGPRTAEFEQAFAAFIGQPRGDVQAVASCSAGLFHAVAALGLGPGDEVILPTISFVGAAHAASCTGARVVLCDVDPRTLNPTIEHVQQVLTPASKAVMILHYGGLPGDVIEIADLAKDRGLMLIEDAAISLGSSVSGGMCGTFGDVGVWSFDSMKVLSCGDGGMVWCRSAEVADEIHTSVRLGVAASGFDRRGDTSSWWEVEPAMASRRDTMNDIAAAIGLTQLERVNGFLRRRAEIADTYDAALSDLAWLQRPPRRGPEEARTFYWIQAPRGVRNALAAHLLERGVYTTFRYWPLHRTRIYHDTNPFPGADHAAESTLLLPLYQGLTNSDVASVVSAVADFSPPANR